VTYRPISIRCGRKLRADIRHDVRVSPRTDRGRAKLVTHPLLPYQRESVLHLAFGERALLADDMGLGKTVQGAPALRNLPDDQQRVRRVSVSGSLDSRNATSLACSNVGHPGLQAPVEGRIHLRAFMTSIAAA
jgi:hypothetical protein